MARGAATPLAGQAVRRRGEDGRDDLRVLEVGDRRPLRHGPCEDPRHPARHRCPPAVDRGRGARRRARPRAVRRVDLQPSTRARTDRGVHAGCAADTPTHRCTWSATTGAIRTRISARCIAASTAGDADSLAPSTCPRRQLQQLYRQARAFVFLSEYEGLGLTPLEALAAGIPSLLLDTRGGAGELRRRGPVRRRSAASDAHRRVNSSGCCTTSLRVARCWPKRPPRWRATTGPTAARDTLQVARGCPVMELSIIIVSYNTKSHLVTMPRVAPPHPPAASHEIIVVDNASADGSADVAAGFGGVQVIRRERNVGFACRQQRRDQGQHGRASAAAEQRHDRSARSDRRTAGPPAARAGRRPSSVRGSWTARGAPNCRSGR